MRTHVHTPRRISCDRRLTLIPALFLLAAMALPARAAVPTVISYQGKLMQPTGTPVPDGTVSMTFAIYDAANTVKWTETNPTVAVKSGLFNVMLGGVTPLPSNVFDGSDRFLGIKVGTDSELIPRQRIASTAYAQVAGSADTAKTAANGTPVGGIIMWSGAVADIPAGWNLCDGSNGTPNLRDKFVVGAGAAYAPAATGGRSVIELAHSHTVNDHAHNANHSHGMDAAGDHAHSGTTNGGNYRPDWSSDLYYQKQYAYGPPTHSHDFSTSGGGSHAHGIQGNNFNTGGAAPGTNSQLGSTNILPPYFALCFIMKTAN